MVPRITSYNVCYTKLLRRVAGAVVLMAGLEVFEGLKIGYSYDVQTTSLIRYTQGTHEIVANYCFKIGVEKAPQKYKSIRFL